MNPLLVPPRLLFRVLDDLHSLARTAETIAAAAERFQSVDLDAGLEHLAVVGAAAARLPELEAALAGIEQQALIRIASLDDRLGKVIDLVERIQGGLPVIGEVLDRVAGLETQLGAALEIVGRLESDIASLGRIAPSVDILTEAAGRLADTAEPLQGASERLGRIADRLPGSSRARA